MATAIGSSNRSVREQVSAAEWEQRVALAAAFRAVAHFGWDDLIFTHLSARVPGEEGQFLINPLLMFDEITAVQHRQDRPGRKPGAADAACREPGGLRDPLAIHAARPDAHAVMHLHTPYGQAVSAMADGLLPQTQTAMIAHHDVAYHDYEGIASELDERARLVADLGARNTMLLRNHGTLAVGETIAQAFLRLYFLERACEAQVHMLAAGRERLCEPPHGAADKVREQSSGPRASVIADGLVWPALIRKLDRIDPSFRD
jgi:ribulose-5-phosphate 4-epimerase/fuculose-1-phosphate aldolase